MLLKKNGKTVDFLLTAKSDRKAALRFFRKAITSGGVPEKINDDKSGASTAGIKDFNEKKPIGQSQVFPILLETLI